jgi:hypothetical protein
LRHPQAPDQYHIEWGRAVDTEHGRTVVLVDADHHAIVTPGSGLLYREITGSPDGGGPVYLVTDTGLRYGRVQPLPVPRFWSAFLPKGPTLDSPDATQPQGS